MNPDKLKLRRQVSVAAIALAIIAMSFDQWLDLRSLDNDLSPTADAWTEADTIRAADAYARLGFAANAGLPDLCFGNHFPNDGTKKMLREVGSPYGSWRAGALAGRADTVDGEHFIYTHYPPGPHWLAGLMTVAFGHGEVGLYRVLPLVLGIVSIIYLAWEMSRHLGATVTAASVLLFVSLPMFTNMMHGLSYQGYALALLLVELALCLRLVHKGWGGPGIGLALFAIGFLQGWLGFDYFFLVALAPATVWMASCATTISWRSVAFSCALCAAGYLGAHLLHLLQVAAYYGSISTALQDFVAVAQYRSSGETFDNGRLMKPLPKIVWDYLTTHTESSLHFNAPILMFAACGLFLLLLVSAAKIQYNSAMKTAAIALALVVSSCWVALMPQHSAQHWHFITRHYFLTVFVTVLATASLLRQVHRLRPDQLTILWLAALPIVATLALVLRNSFAGPMAIAIFPLASVEGLAAYGIVAGVLLFNVRRGTTWPRLLAWAPILYAATIYAFMSVRAAVWSARIDVLASEPMDRALAALSAIIMGYGVLALGRLVFQRLDRNGYFAAAS